MRVDQRNVTDIAKANNHVEVKGNVDISVQETAVGQVEGTAGGAHAVQQTAVGKPLFSANPDSELDKIRQEAENLEAKAYQDKMAVISNTATGKDCARMEDDGYSLNDTDVETIVTEMDKIKMELAKAGVDISAFGDDLSYEQLEQMTGSIGMAQQIQRSMEEADIPATEENVSGCQETAEQAKDLTKCSESAVKYLVDNNLLPTVDNLYKAQHSTGSASAVKAPQEEVELDASLKKQVEQVITKAGLPVNETTLGYSKWMMEQELPLTPENLKYVSDLNQAQFPPDSGMVMNAMIEAVQEGGVPGDAVVLPGYSLMDRAQQAAQVVEQAADQDVWSVVEHGEPVTIAAVEAAHNQNAAQNQESGQNTQNGSPQLPEYAAEDIKFITARRQLEEIRLMMTEQASYTMLRQGIEIETKPLEELVGQLKDLEQNYYKNLLSQNGIEATETNTALFAETVGKTEELKSAPAYLLGGADLKQDTVNTLYDSGTAMKEKFQRAGQAYESLMTVPDARLGDSLEKAFQNMDALLADIGMESSEANRRAVRMLAYNQLPVTGESVAQMKAADQKVQVLFGNLSPSVVMEMIREGINPLEMDISQLNAKAEQLKHQKDAGGEEKFSKYLWKLEQRNEVSQEERDSYIGIYRLLNQIDKTDGAAIGSLVNQGAELNMKNLLGAVRTRNQQGMDVTVNDDYTGEARPDESSSISRQIETAYQTDCAKEAFGLLTPEGVEQVQTRQPIGEMTPEQLLWELRNSKVDQESEDAYYQQQLKEFSLAKETETQVLQMLTGHDMPVTAYNVLAANQMLNHRNNIFRSLFEPEEGEDDVDLEAAKQEILEDFAEAVKTPEDMARAQKKLADTAENVMNTMAERKDVQSIDIKDLKIMRQEIELGTRMAREENYAIPVLVADELTNVQLKIVRGTDERGRVDVIFDSPVIGKVAAKFQVQGAKVKGYIAADSEDFAKELQNQADELQESLSMEGELFPDLNIIRSESVDLARFSSDNRRYGETGGQTEEAYQVQTKTLYGIARNFLDTVKRLGNAAVQ